MLNKLINKAIDILNKHKEPVPIQNIIMSLTLNTAALGLMKGEFIELAPVKGTCGNIKLSGNSLPVIEYTVFEKKIMEFITVTVQVSKPDRIQYISKIKSSDPKFDGKEVDTIQKYKEPFIHLSQCLFIYFPFPPMSGGGVKLNEKIQVQDAVTAS